MGPGTQASLLQSFPRLVQPSLSPPTLPAPAPSITPLPHRSFLQGLFALANDTSNRVRKEVVVGLVTATSFLPDRVAPFMGQLVEYMLASNEHADPAVALAAAEFWTAYLELQLDPGLLRPALPRLIPVLLKNMVRRGERQSVG